MQQIPNSLSSNSISLGVSNDSLIPMVSSQSSRLKPFLTGGLFLLIILHFFLVILGSIDFDLNRWGRLGKILNIYGEATGTNSQFAFFSPGISSQIRVRFVIKNKDGLLNTVDMINAKDREASLRVGNIFDQFIAIEESDDEDSSDLRRSLAASLAGTMFARHPEAESVTVKIDEYIPSDLHKKNTDAAPAWNTIYEIEFASKERRQ